MNSLSSLTGGKSPSSTLWRITLLMAAVSALVLGLTFYTGREMDRQALAQQRALVDNALTSRLNAGVGELRSVAWWDEAMIKSSREGFNRDWLDQEVGSYMNESYRHDRIAILDEQSRPVYSYGEDYSLGSKQLASDMHAASAILEQARGGKQASPRVNSNAKPGELYETAQFNGRRFSRGFGAIVSIDGKPAIALASLITPSFDTSTKPPIRRIILTLIELSNDVLAGVGGDVLLPDLAFAKASVLRDGHLSLKTDEGKPLAQIDWTAKKPGSEMVKRILPFIVIALLFASLVMAYLLRRLAKSTMVIKEREAESRHLANHDVLTGLPNRRRLESELFERGGQANDDQLRLACAIIDLDRFKDINDTLGHAAGDALIKGIGKRLEQQLHTTDFIARLGGDEFAILRDCASLADADDLSNTITSIFAEPVDVMGHQLEASASIGMAVSGFERAVDNLMRESDIALYEAKAKARGTTVRFAPAMATKIEQRRMLEIDLKHVIAERGLTMHYQPIVDAANGAVHAVEALLRWNSPKHGNVPPDVFVAIAEETGMMADLGRFVIEQSIEDAQRWPSVQTSINISPAQLRSASLVNDLLSAARRNGVSPTKIALEITETVLMTNDKRTLRTLNILKEHGFSLSLDDFGTGYSSLAYVRDFPFDKLKIDRSFVTGAQTGTRSLNIVEAVVNFGLILGREVIAEGIETEQEMQAMQAAGATHLQGYLFSRPVTATHIEALIATSGRLTATRTVEREVTEPSRIDTSLATRLRRAS